MPDMIFYPVLYTSIAVIVTAIPTLCVFSVWVLLLLFRRTRP